MSKLKSIYERQNEDYFIELLAAQRIVYADGKQLNTWAFWLSLVLPILFTFIDFLIHKASPETTFFYDHTIIIGVLVLIFIVITSLEIIACQKQQKAAWIQEKLDTELLGIKKQAGFKEERVSDEEIARQAIRYEKDDLKNWYNNYSEDLSEGIAVLKCQMENLYWDSKQRKAFSIVLLVYIGLFLLLLAITWIAYYQSYLFNLTLLLIPFGVRSSYQILRNWFAATITKKRYFDAKLKVKKAENTAKEDYDPKALGALHREIQDTIYRGRKTLLPVPDWYYNVFRDRVVNKVYSVPLPKGEILIEMKSTPFSIFRMNRLQKSTKNFDKAFESVNEFSKGILNKLEFEKYEEVTLEMGIKVEGNIGAMIAKGSGEGQVKVVLKWNRAMKAIAENDNKE